MRPEWFSAILSEGEPEQGAAATARLIEDAISATGWQIGTVFASETELVGRFGLSRPMIRQAERLLEVRGSARMRRGSLGGLVVGLPSRDVAARALTFYFQLAGASRQHVTQAQRLLAPAIARWAAERGGQPAAPPGTDDDPPNTRLGGFLRRRALVRRSIVGHCDSACLDLIALCLERLEVAHMAGDAACEAAMSCEPELDRLEAAILDAIASRDPDQAEALALCHGRLLADLLETPATRGGPDPALDPTPGRGDPHRAARIARRIAGAISEDGCVAQNRLGSTAELCDRFGAGRPVLTQAVRLLEDFGVVESRRGRGGGLRLRPPPLSSAVRLTHSYFAARRLSAGDCSRLIWITNLSSVRAAAEAAGPADHVRLRRALQSLHGANDDTSRALHWMALQKTIAAVGCNPLLHTLTLCLLGYGSRSFLDEQVVSPAHVDALLADTGEVVSAILRGDPDATQPPQQRLHRLFDSLFVPSRADGAVSSPI